MELFEFEGGRFMRGVGLWGFHLSINAIYEMRLPRERKIAELVVRWEFIGLSEWIITWMLWFVSLDFVESLL